MSAALQDRLARATLTKAEYTPGELARISALSTDMQRVWRRRGQLPTRSAGHARFSIAEAIETTFRYALSKVGIPPSEVQLDLSAAASAAMLHAVFTHGGCEVIGPADEVDEFLTTFAEDSGQLGSLLVGCPTASHYLVLDEWHQARIVDDPYHLIADTEELNVVFNLALIGARLVERGRKPIITVEFPQRPGQRTVRRLTGIGSNDS
ncbi:hypothetical protein GCM10023264_10750 [Sphingomonas daechungensis]|uniref:MerR family transcriptional regulator n=1 Tax=Sphingomonas daechungensis TaxID=1176646 RepID=A0ABX6T4Z0_9SPHN|nr:hypothetical protein [Sphingomonas daechungensis]QNP44604.1 hypothetical protein H9L15_16110 [Sphingomonas daechungensis]